MNIQVLLEVGPDPHSVERIAACLAACPWAWPGPGPARDHAVACTGIEGPPGAPLGHAPVLARCKDGGAVLCCVAGGAASGLEPHPAAPEIGWEVAAVRAELSRCLPLRAGPDQAVFYAIDSTACSIPRLEGRSVGLSAALARASATLGRAVPGDVACSATVDQGGALGGVEAWPQKAEALALLPQVTRVLVAADDVDRAQAAITQLPGMSVEVLGLATLHDALCEVFGVDYPVAAARRCRAQERAPLIDSLFADALRGTSSFIDWGPTYQVADEALRWPDLDFRRRGQLQFVRAVACRYVREATEPDLPSDAWCRALPPGVQSRVLPHVFQHHARWGGTPSGWALETIDALQAQAQTADSLKVRGAWARWIDGDGRHERALHEHRSIVEGWLELYEYPEASYSLCEWLRLAGALDREDSFEEADRISQQLESSDRFGPVQLMYIRIARAQGAWALSLSGLRPDLVPRARGELRRVLDGAPDRPNWWCRLQSVALRYLALLEPDIDPPGGGVEADRMDDLNRNMVALARGRLELRDWLDSLPAPYRWRAGPLAEQGVEHVLRFFVDA